MKTISATIEGMSENVQTIDNGVLYKLMLFFYWYYGVKKLKYPN